MVASTLLFVAAVTLSACGGNGKSDSGAAPTSVPPSTKPANVVAPGGDGVGEVELLEKIGSNYWIFDPVASDMAGPFGPALDLNFANGTQVLGSTACYMFNTTFQISGGNGIRIAESKPKDTSNNGVCEAAMVEPEKAYMKALFEADHVEITESGQLVLSGADVRLVFDVAGGDANMPGIASTP